MIEPTASASADAMADSIVRDLAPKRVLDVGCGTGALLAALARRGCDVDGLERADFALEACRRRGVRARAFDLERDELAASERFDVAMSFEVAEHLSPATADRFVSLLTRASDRVVLSAARPGQGGLDHLNEQVPAYWIAKFAGRGFAEATALRDEWRREWTARDVVGWYRENLMIFEKQSVQSADR